MSEIDDGGLAFPSEYYAEQGMTLRDYFAAAALTGLFDKVDDRYRWQNKDGDDRYVEGRKFEKISCLPENTVDQWREVETPFQRLAWMSYEMADAMIEARKGEA